MSAILVFCEFHGTEFKRGAYELLTVAKKSGRTIHAVTVGEGCKALASQLGPWGVTEVLVCEDVKAKDYNPELYTLLLKEILKSGKYDTILASSSGLARDLFPRVAQAIDAAIISDCTELTITGDQIQTRKPLYSGKCTAAVEFANCKTKIILMRPNQLPIGEASGGEAVVREILLPPTDLKTKIKEIVKGTSEKLDLTEANIIVSGGRGMKGPEHFKLLEELADVLGATVGASRAVVDAGWVSHSMQVGQTGKTVAPSLYIACGISGAIQHLAGMSGSKVIVAINTDKDAPIFQRATYGIVGDAFEVLPALTTEFKKMLQ